VEKAYAVKLASEDGFSYAGFDIQVTVPDGEYYNYGLSSVACKKGRNSTALEYDKDYTFTWNTESATNGSNAGLMTLGVDDETSVATKSGTITITETGAKTIASLVATSTSNASGNGGNMSQTPQLTVTFTDDNNEDLSTSVDLGNIPSLDTRALKELLNDVDGLKASDYTADSWDALNSALAAIEAATSEDSADALTQDELDKLVAAAVTAHVNLVSKDATDPEPGNGDDKNQNSGNNDEKDDDKGEAVSATDIADDSSNVSTLTQTGDAAASSTTASSLTQTGDTAAAGAAGVGLMGLIAAAFAALSSRRRARDK
jgi:hypothetical protein